MLAPLATLTDLAERGITVQPGEEDRATLWLTVASTAIRDAAGTPISQNTSTVVLEGTRGQRLRLPGPPVQSVGTVLIDGEPVDPEQFRLASGALWRWQGWRHPWRWWCEPTAVTVTYTHGLPEVPADIVDLTCSLVAAALVASRAADDGSGLAASPGVSREAIDDYSVTYETAETGLTTLDLPNSVRSMLAARFGASIGMVRSI